MTRATQGPRATRGQPDGNPRATRGQPEGSPRAAQRRPEGNPGATRGQPEGNSLAAKARRDDRYQAPTTRPTYPPNACLAEKSSGLKEKSFSKRLPSTRIPTAAVCGVGSLLHTAPSPAAQTSRSSRSQVALYHPVSFLRWLVGY